MLRFRAIQLHLPFAKDYIFFQHRIFFFKVFLTLFFSLFFFSLFFFFQPPSPSPAMSPALSSLPPPLKKMPVKTKRWRRIKS